MALTRQQSHSGLLRSTAQRPRPCAPAPPQHPRAPAPARRAGPARALPRLADLLPQLPWALPGGRSTKGKPNPVAAERDELLELLLAGGGGGGAAASEARERASSLVDALAAAELPFNERLLGGGPWVVVYTRGSPQLWRSAWATGKVVSGRQNEASQEFNPDGRTALNKVEFFGGGLYVTAAGTYEPLDPSGGAGPQAVRADIERGALHAFGLDIPLPIRGSGRFEVLYLDDALRVFRSGNAVTVQMKRSELQQRLLSTAG
ncbi:metallo-dependent phosphatase [Raphidocelis subcapitata]|uniref:Metallo-dependent phosphatase n=1 Tax=Raphidocelis subcapitata TaxID=307507 RepID=A0A2V0NWW4_9CHLO|nr:metallo-dependent phosphatase [Raphidocelis subcapitata]|eukprot:GBF91172.1 metallo-dependent phosphatase [Raphidocelis subcapitata]